MNQRIIKCYKKIGTWSIDRDIDANSTRLSGYVSSIGGLISIGVVVHNIPYGIITFIITLIARVIAGRIDKIMKVTKCFNYRISIRQPIYVGTLGVKDEKKRIP